MQTFHSIWLLNIQLRNVYVLKLLIMLEISLITVIYKRIGKFCYITQSELNSCKWRVFVCRSLVEIPSNSIKFAKYDLLIFKSGNF
jgi:hypothetical protein